MYASTRAAGVSRERNLKGRPARAGQEHRPKSARKVVPARLMLGERSLHATRKCHERAHREQATPTKLGAFTGGQITVIAITCVLAIADPVGASAVTRSNVYITDRVTGGHAGVDASGRLATADVPAVGSILASGLAIGGTPECAFVTPPAGKALVITGVELAPHGAAAGTEAQANVYVHANGSCSGTIIHSVAFAYFSSDQPQEVTMSPGVGLKTGHFIGLGDNTIGTDMWVTLYGYYIPASQCSPTCL